MADVLRDVTPGQPLEFRAAAVNAWNEAARLARRRFETGAGADRGGADAASLVVLVRNDTGGDLPIRSVLKITDPVLSLVDHPLAIQDQPAFSAVAPAAATDLVVITLEPIAEDRIGRAALAGVALVEVSVGSSGHTHATPSSGVTARLASGTSGIARIISKESGTGNKRAVVLLGGGGGSGGEFVRGTLDGTLTFGGSATLSVYSAGSDTGANVTVHDTLLLSGQTVAAGKFVTAGWEASSGRYYVTGAQCS